MKFEVQKGGAHRYDRRRSALTWAAITGSAAALAHGWAWAADPPAGTARHGYGEVLKPRQGNSGKAIQVLQPYTPIKRLDDEGQVPEIEMFVGESRVFPSPGVARIAVGNGSLLTAAALDNKEVILFANAPGTSSLFVWNADGRYQRVKISIVPGDTSRHAREIAAFLSTIPKAKASIVGANIIVEGDELSDADMMKIDELGKRYPQIVNFTNRLGWEQMVLLDVKVVEFPTTTLTEMGLKWTGTGGAAVGGIWGLGRRGHSGPYQIDIRTGEATAPPIVAPGGGSVVVPSGLNVLSVLNMGLNAQLNLLAQEGKAAILAEPQLSARSGAKADFLAGGEIPYSVVTPNGVHVQFKSYGIKLEITPRVDHKGVIRATIKSEVSSVDRSISTSAGPALLSRQTNTEFNLRAGETIVLSGLLQRDTSADVDKVPLLGDIPVLGALFRSKRYQNKETELVVFVTPTVVGAQSPGMVDRIGRTTERLEQRFGPSPYLTDPLQPGVRYEQPDSLSPSPAAASAVSPAAQAPTPVTPAPIVPLPEAVPRPADGAALSTSSNLLDPAQPRQAQAQTFAAPAPAAASSPTAPVPHQAQLGPGQGLARSIAHDTALRAEPSDGAAVLLQLGTGAAVMLGAGETRQVGAVLWRQVEVGRTRGWIPAGDLQQMRDVAGRAASSPVARQDQAGKWARTPVTPRDGGEPRGVTAPEVAPGAKLQQYRVRLDKLPVRVTPDMNAGVVAELIEGDVVEAPADGRHGTWMPVRYRSGAGRVTGWVATQWLEPLPVHRP